MNILRLRMVWEHLARHDPFWAVLAASEKAGNRWKIDEFFDLGTREVEASLTTLAHHMPGLPRERALDFGCGVGRLTQGLGHHYQQVIGVDVAAGMIGLANRHNRTPAKVSFVHNPRADLQRFASDHFDLVFSLITLQHVPPPLIEAYVREFVRVARPGGALYFQIPTSVPVIPQEIKEWSLYPPTMWKRLKRWSGRWFRKTTGIGDVMRMNALPEERVRMILATAGAKLIATIDHPIGNGYASQIYVACKPVRGPASA
jgi:ubiquinone/menaquinone biosynthesis C-methylase UbiE